VPDPADHPVARYRRLSAAAHNVLHAMASGLAHDGEAYFADHLAWAAARAGAAEIRLDLLAGTVEPAEAATPALVRYAERGRAWWPATLAGVGADPARVRSVVVRGILDPGRREAAGGRLGGEAARVVALTAVVTDDRGVAHVGAPPRDQLHLAP
jgi:hypothetical protein